LSTVNGWAWDDRYAQDGWAFGTEPNDFLRQQAHLIPPGRVLCLGEGEGRNATFLAEEGYEVVGVDRSQVGMDKAQGLAQEKGVFIETVVSSIEDFELAEGEWQGVISIFFHLPKELRQRVNRSVVDGLAPGGILVLEGYTPKQLDFGTGGPPDAERLVSLETLEKELSGLEVVVAQETEREVHEGRMHTGQGSVVQFVGRKV
jgi:SAM-dependent methyltransferase